MAVATDERVRMKFRNKSSRCNEALFNRDETPHQNTYLLCTPGHPKTPRKSLTVLFAAVVRCFEHSGCDG